LPTLRAFRGKLGDSALGRGRVDLLRVQGLRTGEK